MANDWNELRYRYLAKQNKYYYDDSILWDFIYLNATSRNTYITKIVSGETTYDKWEVVNSDNTVMANDYNKMAEEAGISNRVSSGQVVTAALINALTQNL